MPKIFDFSRLKRGLKPPRYDACRFHFRHYLRPGAMDTVPAAFDYADGVAYQMWNNDSIGCCTAAASAGWFTTWLTKAGAQFEPITDGDVLALYEATGGYRPDDPSTDNGAEIADVLSYLRSTGLAGRKIGAYGDVSFSRLDILKAAVYFSEGLSCGIQVPNYCEQTTDWLEPSNDVAGGHNILLTGHDGTHFKGVTWAERVTISDAFIQAQFMEAHWALSHSQLSGQGVAANGLNLGELQADLANLN